MITLTNPIAVTTTLGSTSKTNYDRLDITTINMDVTTKNINGNCQLISSVTPGAAVIQGSYSIPTSGSAILTITIPSVPFFGQVTLTAPQQTTVQGWVSGTQNNIESGLVAVGVVAGVQSAGL